MDSMSFLITDPTDQQTAIRESYIAHAMGNALKRAYPGRDWVIKIDIETGVASVHCPHISLAYGAVISLATPLHIIQKKAVHFGGQLLERFCLSRCIVKDGDAENLPRTALGFVQRVKEGGF